MLQYLIRRLLWAVRPLRRSDADHVRPLLPAACRPRAARCGQVGDRGGRRPGVAPAGARPARPRAVRPLSQAADRRPLARALVRQPALGQRDGGRGRSGHHGARPRRRRPVDADRAAHRDPLGVAPALAHRQGGDDLHPHRHLGAGRVDRPAPPVLRRLQVGPDAERGVLRRHRPAGGRVVRRPRRLGLPHDPALADVRDPLRRELRPDDPRERDGHARRGLRAHGAREGRAGERRDPPPRAPQRAAAGRDDARPRHRRGARRRDLHRGDLQPARASDGSR